MTKKTTLPLSTTIKHCLFETSKLLWQFKWYIICDIIIFGILLLEYLNPPAANDPIWGSEHVYGLWYYQSQQLYLQNCAYNLIIGVLLFLIGTSNMRTHPKLAKLVFLLIVAPTLWAFIRNTLSMPF